MQFVHIADTHLGYKQYGEIKREDDYYSVFENTIQKIIEINPDFVIHSGDLFEFNKPTTKALLVFQNGLSQLNKHNIPIYAIAGNHDSIQKQNSLPPQVLFRNMGLKLISPKTPFFIHEDIFIGGIPYTPKTQNNHLKDALKEVENLSKDYKKRILVLHQGIDSFLPPNAPYELELADIPTTFHYYALGHIHARHERDFGEGKLVYPGSMEVGRKDEIKNYIYKGKGFSLVDISNNNPQIENINIELPRKQIIEKIFYPELYSSLEKIKSHISKLDNKPILNIDIEGGNFSKSEVYDLINKELKEKSLLLKLRFNMTKIETQMEPRNDNLTPHSLIKNQLTDLFDDDTGDFGVLLFNALNSNDKEIDVKEFCDEFMREKL